MDTQQTDTWKIVKQFEIKAKNYWKLLGYGWHIAIITVPILVIWLIFCHLKQQPIKPDQRENKGTIVNNYGNTTRWEFGVTPGLFYYNDKTGYSIQLTFKRKF
jgi:hypothetical protein